MLLNERMLESYVYARKWYVMFRLPIWICACVCVRVCACVYVRVCECV